MGVDMNEGLLSVVVPAYNESLVLSEFHRRLCGVVDALPMRAEIIYVNDGSTDGTLSSLEDIQAADPRVGLIDLSRNFGKEIALTAGIDHAAGDALIVIDADLQDPPELIHKLLQEWHDGYDVVYAQRVSRKGETVLKRLTSHVFYRVMGLLGSVQIPRDTGDFRLLSRRAVNSLKEIREQHRFMKGLFTWIGYPQKAVPYEREPRFAGLTKWSYMRLLKSIGVRSLKLTVQIEHAYKVPWQCRQTYDFLIRHTLI